MRRILADRPLTSAERNARHYAAHRAERKAASAEYHRQHPEVCRDAFRRAYATNPEKQRARTMAAYQRDPEPFIRRNLRRRARMTDAFVEDVSVAALVSRQGGLCGICGLPMATNDVSLDHRVPLARGGEHSYANCRAAHLVCNKRKGAN